MGKEYKIKFAVPQSYDASHLSARLPDANSSQWDCDIYGYSVESDGFYFVDYLVDSGVAAIALRLIIDEGLLHGSSIEVLEV